MIIFKKSSDIKKYLSLHAEKKRGYVPTMGALHDGHASLVRLAGQENDLVIVSIFVNPLQFNDRSDYEKYPSTIDRDIELLEQLHTDILFLPEEKEIYPEGDAVSKMFNLGNLENVLEGASRPGHFQGVARVMDILLKIIQPENLYLGRKDFQQVKVIQKLIGLEGLGTKITEAPIIRETSGLAMSSRNQRLDDSSRLEAGLIFKNLQYIKDHSLEKSFSELREVAINKLEHAGFEIDYLVLANQNTLAEMDDFARGVAMILLIAVHFHNVRLIDNLEL